MAEMQTASPGKRGRFVKVRSKKTSTRIDLTPMVDLGFLLITFFMLATVFVKPNVMELTMPIVDDITEPPQLTHDKALTVLLGDNNKVYYYRGVYDAHLDSTDFSPEGIREKINQHRKYVGAQYASQASKTSSKNPEDLAVILIKPMDVSKYKNLVDILDEMHITGSTRYMIVKPVKAEIEWVKNPNESLTSLMSTVK